VFSVLNFTLIAHVFRLAADESAAMP
jgi:hypothetical protein